MPSQLFARVIIFAALFCTAASAAPNYIEVKKAVFDHTALQPGQQAVAAIVVEINPKYHTQSHTPSSSNYIKFMVNVEKNPALTLRKVVYPSGKAYKIKDDDKPLDVYTGKITVYLLFDVTPEASIAPLKVRGKVSYQACDDDQCYRPSKTPFTIDTKIVPPGQTVKAQDTDVFKGFDPLEWTKSDVEVTAAPQAAETQQKLFGGFVLKKNSFFLAFIAAFLAGIIFNAVPCVLPVLPLKAIGFYEVSQHNRAKSIAFGAVFSLGLIASFAALAVVIVVKKLVGWGEIYSNVWFNIAIVTILLVMAIGTFGAFSVNLPVGIYNITPRHDTYLGNFLFGILTAVLSTPCTFGLFLGLLVWAVDQPPAIGVSLLMTVGAGMASPYFVLSAFPELARKFPRTGPWSELVKQMMSFLLLGSAVFFARRFIQPYTGPDAFWWVLFGVAALSGLFLFFRSLQITANTGPRVVTFVIAALLIGGTYIVVRQIVNQPYAWTPYSSQLLETAKKSKRVVVVEFTATWCSTCQYLEVHTLHSPEVVSAVKKNNVEMLKADITLANAVGWPLLKEVNPVPAIPFTVVYGPGSTDPQKLTGIYSPQDLTHAIENAAQTAVARE